MSDSRSLVNDMCSTTSGQRLMSIHPRCDRLVEAMSIGQLSTDYVVSADTSLLRAAVIRPYERHWTGSSNKSDCEPDLERTSRVSALRGSYAHH